MTGTRYQNCMARMFVSESDTIQYSRKAKRRPEVMQWFSRYFCGNYWLEKGEAADWLFACILRKIDVWTATWSQCWSMLDSLNKCYGQWVRILASMAGRNLLVTGPQLLILCRFPLKTPHPVKFWKGCDGSPDGAHNVSSSDGQITKFGQIWPNLTGPKWEGWSTRIANLTGPSRLG